MIGTIILSPVKAKTKYPWYTFQGRNVRHEPIDVPKHSSLFLTSEAEEIFAKALAEVNDEGIIPAGFGVAEAEWDDGIYNSVVALPFAIWWPRAVSWTQGLELMLHIQAVENGEIEL
ncbi:hypothetical protein B0H14DRAFT_3559579 [Mycena olivaceomarginata]|nr:hypothetical protein B0H14DRAFT_3559579 [Mycena olivaceomarginata]